MNKNVKLIISFLGLLALTHLAYAADSGSYAGVDVGDSKFQTPNESLFNTPIPGDNLFVKNYDWENNGKLPHQPSGFAGRLFGGYNFNSYFGIETGIARYSRSKYIGNIGTTNSSLEYSMSAIDLMLKAYLPLGDSKLNIYATGALARTHTINENDNFTDNLMGSSGAMAPYEKARPMIGIGTSYDIPNTALTTGFEFNRLKGADIKTDPNAIPSADMLMFNFSYHLN